MAAGDAHVFPGFLTPVLTQIFFPKPPTKNIGLLMEGRTDRQMERMNSVLRPVDNLGHIGRTYLENNNAR